MSALPESHQEWLSSALVPGWALFRPSFLRRRKLSALLIYGSISQHVLSDAFRPSVTFPAGLLWGDVDLQCVSVTSDLVLLSPEELANESVWHNMQSANGVVWSPRKNFYAVFAGTDSFCVGATGECLQSAFGHAARTFDDEVRHRASDTLEQLNDREPNPFDDVWLRNLSWLNHVRNE